MIVISRRPPSIALLAALRLGETVHFCNWSGQPDLHIACGEPWTTPRWEGAATAIEGVYWSDDGRLYSFERGKTTCATCKVAPPYVG